MAWFLSGCRPGPDRFLNLSLPGLAGDAKVVFELEAKPEFGRGPQVASQAEGGIRRDAPAAADDIVEAGCGDAQRLGELVNAHAQRFEDVPAQGLAGVGSGY
jgi:hypothetical protein